MDRLLDRRRAVPLSRSPSAGGPWFFYSIKKEATPASFRLKTRAIDDFTSKSLALIRTQDRRGEALVVASRRPDRHRARRFGPTPTRQAGCQAAPAQAVEKADAAAPRHDHRQAGQLWGGQKGS